MWRKEKRNTRRRKKKMKEELRAVYTCAATKASQDMDTEISHNQVNIDPLISPTQLNKGHTGTHSNLSLYKVIKGVTLLTDITGNFNLK